MVKGKGTFGDYRNFAYLCNVNKTTIMKTVSYISQVERAISVIRAKNKNFDTYNDVIKHGQIFGLVRLAFTNNEGTDPDKFDMDAHYSNMGNVILCDCRDLTEGMADRIDDAIRKKGYYCPM